MNALRVERSEVESATSWPWPIVVESALLVCVLSLVALWWQHPRYGRNTGPKIFPVVGCFPQVLMNLHRLYDWHTDELLKTPTTTVRAPAIGRELIRTAHPANVEHILKTKFENYPKGQSFRTFFSEFAGVGMLNADGSVWKLQRRFASPNFSTQMIRGLALTSVQRGLTERFIPILESFCDSHTAVDLQDLLLRFTFDTFCQFAFATDLACLNSNLSPVPFMTAFDDAVSLSIRRVFTLPPWRTLQKLLDIGNERKLRESLHTVDAVVFDMIKTRRQELADGGQFNHEISDVLSKCIQQADEFVASPEIKQRLADDPRSKSTTSASDLFLRDFVINAILAGRDTSAVGMSWFFWLLSRNPNVESKIRHEIHATLASRTERNSSSLMSFDELKGMHYLHAALTESMRLYPPVPQDTKEAAADDILPDGTAVAKGTVVSFSMYAMGRNARIWGADCLAFRPERFLGDDGSFLPPSPFAYPVFLAGPRMCLGMDLAMMQMKLVAATLLHRYGFRVADGHRAKGVLSMTMKIEEGLPVFVHRRDG